MNPKFEIASSEEILNHPRQWIVSDRLIFPSGLEYEYVYRKTEGKRVVFIVAITDDDQVLLVRQYRHPLRRDVLDIPGGIVEEDESFEEGALRELREETGYVSDRVELIGKFAVNPAASDFVVWFCLARNVTKVGEPLNTEIEQTTPVLIPISEISQALSNGKIESMFAAAGFMLALSYMPLFYSSKQASNDLNSSRRSIEIVCHKGANEYAPENTFAAAQICIDWEMDYVEIDVNTSKDGVLYILHGPDLDKTTNGKGPIAALTSEEIDKLDAGSWFSPKFAGERVPRLEPYLRWIKGKAKVFLDVKAADTKQLIDLIYDIGMENDCFFWSGDSAWALAFRELDQKLQLKINVENVADVIKSDEHYRANIVEVRLNDMSQGLIDACQQRGIKIMIYHNKKEPEAFREVLRWGVDMINLDHADLFAKVAMEFS